MKEFASDMGLTLFMPHVAGAAYKKTSETAKWMSLYNRSKKIIEITPDMLDSLNYKLENPIDDDINIS